MFEPFIVCHLTRGIIAENSLILYLCRTQRNRSTTCLVTKLVIKIKWNVWSAWNKVACAANSQDARSLKQHLFVTDALLSYDL